MPDLASLTYGLAPLEKQNRLTEGGGTTNSVEGALEDSFSLPENDNVRYLLFINATAKGAWTGGGPVNAGLTVEIQLNGNIVAKDMAFEGESSTITFFASASYSEAVKGGDYKIRVERRNTSKSGLNTNFGLTFNYFAIPVKVS